MKLSVTRLKNILIINFFAFVTSANAQLFYSNGADIRINSGGNIFVNGGVTLDNNSSFVNEGELSTRNNGSLGNLTINNNSSLSGNGDYRVEQDWINNATFVQNNSKVFLDGTTQLITGNTSTVFHELNLLNTSVKRQTINTGIDLTGTLNLNDCELATDQFVMFVANPSPQAVTKAPGNVGFVSSLGNGNLTRTTSQNVSYLFPTGSSLGFVRYRPVELIPADNSTNTYSVRLANNSASTDGFNLTNFDNTVDCDLNDKYYHLINHNSGTANPDITIYHDPITDNSFNGIDQWNTPNSNTWNTLGAVNSNSNFGLAGVKKTGWNNFNSLPFVLSRHRPAPPVISGLTSFCPTSTVLKYVANGSSPASQYNWSVSSGVSFQTQGNDTIYLVWPNSIPGTISVSENAGLNCASVLSTINISPYANPVSNFSVSGGENYSGIYTFRDSSILATTWSWDFGDSQSSTLQNPTHFFDEPGTYTITQIISSADGCKDTSDIKITLNEGILIPNVFTPNGDGKNDVFLLPNLGMKEIKIKIFDRWGILVYEGNGSSVAWDGKSLSGADASNGTYYYLLDVKSSTKDYSTRGTITLLRN